MAGEAVVGALRAILGLDTAQFEDGIKSATSDLQGFQKTLLKIGAALGVGLGLEQIVNSVKTTINSLDELNKVTQKIGVPVEELSALKFAANLADVGLEGLTSSVVKLSKAMSEVAKGSAGPAADAFLALGVQVKNSEGNLRSQSDVLGDLADKFASFRDGAEKTALAVAIFGKAGAQMIPLLNQGREGLKKSADEAKRFGLIVSSETTASAEQFNDNLKRLQGASEGLVITLVQGLLPALVKITNQMVEARDNGEGLVSVGEKIGTVFEYIAFVVRANAVGFEIIINQLAGIAGAIYQIQRGNFAGALEKMKEASDKNAKAIENFGKTFDEFVGNDRQGQLDAITAAWERMDQAARGTPPVLRDATKSLENFIQSTTENVQSLRAQVDLFGQQEGAVARAKFQIQALAAIQKEGGIASEAQRTAIKLFAAEIETLTNKLVALGQEKAFKEGIRSIGLQAREVAGEFTGTLAPGFLSAAQSLKVINEQGTNLGAVLSLTDEKARKLNEALFLLNANRLSQEFLSPYDQYLLKLKEIEASFARQPALADQAASAQLAAAAKAAGAYGSAAQTIVGSMADAFKTMAEGDKKYAGIAKATAIGLATVNTFVAATKAMTELAWSPPLAFAAAAAITAAGLVQVGKIAATEFATGGSFKVGGVGGIDSQTIAMNLTPGEMVDVRKPGQTTTTQEITVNMRGRDIFSGDMIRDLFSAINQGTSDGYRLKLAET